MGEILAWEGSTPTDKHRSPPIRTKYHPPTVNQDQEAAFLPSVLPSVELSLRWLGRRLLKWLRMGEVWNFRRKPTNRCSKSSKCYK